MRYKTGRFTLESTLANIKSFQAQLTDEDRSRIFLHMVASTGNYREIAGMGEARIRDADSGRECWALHM